MTVEHPLVQTARRTIESYVRDGEVVEPPQTLTEEMQRRAGVFVSLHCQGELRGCIGTIEPVQANVALEIISNAISAAMRDPRFAPLRPDELVDLEISVDLLTEPEPIASMDELDPKGVRRDREFRRTAWAAAAGPGGHRHRARAGADRLAQGSRAA